MIVDYGFTTNRMGWFRLHAVYPMVKQAYMLIKQKQGVIKNTVKNCNRHIRLAK